LGRARREVQKGRDIQLVRIYTDAQSMLKALRSGTNCALGPILSDKTALEGVYERTDFLTAAGVVVELVWIKGHSESHGNCLADQAADRAVKARMKQHTPDYNDKQRHKLATKADVPEVFKEMGHDWVKEWIYRANAHLGHGHIHRKRKRDFNIETLDPIENDKPAPLQVPPELQAFDKDFTNYQRSFMLPDLGLYGNVTLDDIIANLHNQRKLIEHQITDVERLIAHGEDDNIMEYLRHKASELYFERDGIRNELEAQIAVQRLEVVEESVTDADDEDRMAIDEEVN
jgi:ribonuclease HI